MKMRKHSGSSLIETMVALIVLGTGLLVVMSMQVKSVTLMKDASLNSQAAFLASDIYEGMLTTPSAEASYFINYTESTPAKPDCATVASSCSPTDMAKWNLHNWRSNVASLLPGGRSEINRIGNQIVIRIEFESGSNADGTRITQEYKLITDV
ncbi:type IV pilus modification protein PilV [Teredinibacter purpureus]|uniref:type IV pilus modification protein PilV n=1 Tax=Teredinibacter purpureus TaxID=2731756 RepID=UPI0005F794AA|nr:type IV pilus modification protein PilV [Teredinibacter purpureus]